MKPSSFFCAACVIYSLAQTQAIAQTPAVASQQPPAPNPPFITNVQDSAIKPDAWRSPKGSLSEFPMLDTNDCKQYGAQYGYSECAGTPPIKADPAVTPAAPVANANASPTPNPAEVDGGAAPIANAAAKPQRQAPIPTRRSAAVSDRGAASEQIASAEDNLASASDPTLQAMAGQLVIVAFEGQSPSDAGPMAAASALKSGAISGVLIRDGNVKDAAQLRELARFFQAQTATPPIVALERPGGVALALTPARGFKSFPSAAEIGAAADALDAFNRYKDMAAELSALGVTFNLGPSANICAANAPDKPHCFGAAPPHVASFATAFNFGHHEAGVLAGTRYAMSAGDPSNIEALRDVMRRLAPDALVVGFDGGGPASRDAAAKALASVRETGFDGVFAVEIAGAKSAADLGDAVVQAVETGADVVLLIEPRRDQVETWGPAVEALKSAVQSGRIAMPRLEESNRRVAQLRARLRDWKNGPVGDITSSTGTGTMAR